jgi:hypothetical protein
MVYVYVRTYHGTRVPYHGLVPLVWYHFGMVPFGMVPKWYSTNGTYHGTTRVPGQAGMIDEWYHGTFGGCLEGRGWWTTHYARARHSLSSAVHYFNTGIGMRPRPSRFCGMCETSNNNARDSAPMHPARYDWNSEHNAKQPRGLTYICTRPSLPTGDNPHHRPHHRRPVDSLGPPTATRRCTRRDARCTAFHGQVGIGSVAHCQPRTDHRVQYVLLARGWKRTDQRPTLYKRRKYVPRRTYTKRPRESGATDQRLGERGGSPDSETQECHGTSTIGMVGH